LSLSDEAIELFADRARLTAPDFVVDEVNVKAVGEICRRLDGMPLAIELAAARVRALSVTEIVDSLHDRFRLLTGGARTAVQRQQTLRASVDWSHTLLTEPERILFRRLSVFMGGFDLDAAQSVAGRGEVARYQVLDQLTLLVDKSLVVAESTIERTRYRLLETVRQYALEKLGESADAEAVRAGHRDHYTAMAALLDTSIPPQHERLSEQCELEIDNLHAAFTWSLERADVAMALQLVSSLQSLWLARGRLLEGAAWFETALTDDYLRHLGDSPAVRARALADKALLDASLNVHDNLDQAQEALALARELDDPALLARALMACGGMAAYDADAARSYFTEAAVLARESGDARILSRILGWQAFAAVTGAGDPQAIRTAGEEGRDLADAIGDRHTSRNCRWSLGHAQWWSGDLVGAVAHFHELAAEAEAAHDEGWRVSSLVSLGHLLAYHGGASEARAAAEKAVDSAAELGPILEGFCYASLAVATLADGDMEAAAEAADTAWRRLSVQRELAVVNVSPLAQIALIRGDLVAARRWADDAVNAARGFHLARALTARSRVAIAQGEPEQAERDAHDALNLAIELRALIDIPDMLECLANLGADSGSHFQALRLFAAADALRQRMGLARFTFDIAAHEAAITALRDVMEHKDFDDAWAEGAALSTEEAIAYAQRGRGGRKRPSSGWGSLTPTELDVVRLVSEGLGNKDIATRLFVSHRTVQTHLTHVYTKLGMTSRVQLAQEAVRRA
jgi:DNA-binding CsgD family transcriptional regulator